MKKQTESNLPYTVQDLTISDLSKAIKILKEVEPPQMKFLECMILKKEVMGIAHVVIPVEGFEFEEGDKIYCIWVKGKKAGLLENEDQ